MQNVVKQVQQQQTAEIITKVNLAVTAIKAAIKDPPRKIDICGCKVRADAKGDTMIEINENYHISTHVVIGKKPPVIHLTKDGKREKNTHCAVYEAGMMKPPYRAARFSPLSLSMFATSLSRCVVSSAVALTSFALSAVEYGMMA